MLNWQNHTKSRLIIRAICSVLVVTFSFSNIQLSQAQDFSINQLPLPGTMLGESAPFAPLALKGLIVNLKKPLEFQFIIDTGRESQDTTSVKDKASQLVKYFLAGLTIPGGDLWVNLSPYEKNKILPEALGQTDLGRDLLAQDYILKQLTASLIYPEKDLGKEFWSRVYARAQEEFGTTNVPVNTFNKVWILPDQAEVFENVNVAYVTKSTLKVMLDEDYLAKQKHASIRSSYRTLPGGRNDTSSIGASIIRQIILPEIEKEVNSGKNFAPLRQIYQALILAKWYKETIQNGLLDALYTNKKKVAGVNVDDPAVKEEIYQRYLKAYKKGAFNYIKEDTTPDGQMVPRKYFSGGITQMGTFFLERTHDGAMLSKNWSAGRGLFLLTVNCATPNSSSGSIDHFVKNIGTNPITATSEKLKLQTETNRAVNPAPIKIIPHQGNTIKSVAEVKQTGQVINTPSMTLANTNFDFSRILEPVVHLYNQAMTVVWAIVGIVGYFIYRIVKNNFAKKKETRKEITTVVVNPVVQMVTASATRRQPPAMVPQIVGPQATGTQITRQSGTSRDYQNPQQDSNLPLVLRRELENHIQQLSNAIAQSSKDTLIRSFRPTGPGELPLPIPITMLNQDANDRDRVIHILENMQRMMDGTDEKVLRDFERAIDNARDRVTEQALNQFDRLSDAEVLGLLTNGYVAELQREFQRIFEEQVQHMDRFYRPSVQEQNLYVSEEINERYPRLPRYLKWILTNNPDLENDYYVREWLNMIQNRVNRIPAFPDMITGYSKAALTKSLYLNPELARRVLLFLARNVSQGSYTTEADVRREIQLELAKGLTEDNFIEGEIIPDAVEEFPAALEAPPQMRALPAPDMGKTESQRARLKTLTDDYNQFMVKFREQEAAISKVETDLRELSEGLAEARKQNDRVIIEALQPAVDGLTSKLRRLKEKLPRLNQDKARYEEQINAIRSELGDSGSMNLYSFNPAAAGIVPAVFAVMFGIPLYITKKILNKWYNTTSGKALGMAASIGALVAGYHVYFDSLSTYTANANPWLVIFFIIWPVAILSGIYGGHVGKGFSHNRLYGKANSAFEKGNFQAAYSYIKAAIALRPKNTRDYMLLADIERRYRHFDLSIESYKAALEIDPNNSDIYNNLGVIYFESGDVEKAIEAYKRSLELEANDPIVLANLGRSLQSQGRLLEAARYLQRAQEIKPNASVTEELNEILRQTGRIAKPNQAQDLSYFKTMRETVPSRSEWVKSAYSDFEDWLGGAFFGGLVAGGAFLYGAYNYHWWQMGTENVTTATQWTVWLSSLISGSVLGMGILYIVGKIADVFITISRFFGYPSDYKKLQEVNKKSSDELSDSDLKAVAPIYARMSKEYLEEIFRSWVEAGQEEKIARLFKFGKWDSDKKRIYGDIGEYKRVSRIAAAKFATNVQEQEAVFDFIDEQKEKMAEKGIAGAITIMKDIIPQVADTSRSRDEFFYWLGLIVNLPKNILEQGQRQVLAVFTDLREYDRAREESFTKFGPVGNSQANSRVNVAIDGLMQRLESDGLSYPAILKKLLADINKTSRNIDEFGFWINEVMRFEKQWFSSGSYMTLLQNLIAYEHAKEEAAKKLTRTQPEKTQLYEAVEGLRAELNTKKINGDVSVLKDVIPKVTEASRTLEEFLEWIAVLKAFDKNMWGSTRTVVDAFGYHVAYKIARAGAADKFTKNDQSRQKFLSDIDDLRAQLVAKGFPQASDLLQAILPELTKTCRTSDEFIYWLGELIGLNTAVWRRGVQAVISNFNDLAGYQLAKETAVEKLATIAQEKADLTKSIDTLKSSLESKVPSCAGFMKDIILEILKDINVLADPPHRKNDFLWYLGKVVNFETPTWVGGTPQVIAGYQEIKRYILDKRAYFAKFTTNTDENKRLQAAHDNLDNSPNFTKPAFIGLLNNALEKVSKIATTPREFVYWVGTFSELQSDVLEIFCRDFDTVLAYYRDKGKARDFNHLPAVLNQYNRTYHQTVLITTNLLDILTDPGVDINKRVENAANFIVEQRIVKLGAPPNLIGLRDIVSFDQLLDNSDIGEGQFRGMLNYTWTEESSDDENGYSSSYSTSSSQHIRTVASKMGTEGLYTYWEAQKATYYQEFLNEGKGLLPGFNRPGEKFRVDYDGKAKGLTADEQKEVQPMLDNVAELKILIQYLREEAPNLYDNFIEPKRELIKGRLLEEFITKESAPKVAIQLLNKVPGWQFDEQQKAIFIMKLMQIMAFPETAEVRAKLASATDSFDRLRETASYWDKVWQYVQKQTYISQKAKYYSALVRSIRQKISMLNDKLMDVGDGVLQFYLSGHTMADFFRGSISGECTAYGGVKFKESIGQITDPSFFLFKIMEKGKWIGNIYSVATKTSDGKYALFVDWFKINRKHPFVTNAQWEDRRKKFIKNFFIQFKSYLASQGFDYLIFATATGDSGSLFTLTQEEAKAEAYNHTTVQTKVKKLGGMGHLKEGDLPTEYIQNFGDPGSQHDVTGYRITLDKATPQILQHKQRDLEYLEKLLGEMSTEEIRLARLSKERQEELRLINQRGQEAANIGRNAVATALKAASEQKSVEIQKIEYELNEIHIRMHEKQDEFDHLAGDLGLPAPKRRSMASRVASVLIPFAITSTLFLTQEAQAQGYYSSGYSNGYSDFLSPILLIAGIGGFLGLVYYLLNKAFPPSQYDRGSYYERTYYPPYWYEDLFLPDDVKTLQGQVLDQVGGENRGLVPDRVDVRIPNQVGIPRSQGIKALTLLYSTILRSKSILEFFKTQEFYTKFKQHTHELGLADDFDQPQNKSYSFTIGKEEIRYEEDRRAEEFIGQYLKKLVEHNDTDQPTVQAAMQKQREGLLRRGWYQPETQSALFAYYQLMLSNTAFESKEKVEAIKRLLSEKNPLGAMSVLEEIYRIDIGGEQIALESNPELRGALNKILQRELDDIHRQFNRSSNFQANKTQVIKEAKDIQFELRLSERTADDILRGVASGDCTSINGSAYYNTIPQFMFDPGLLVFRVMQEGKWIGNVYTIVSEKNNKPVLIVDAVQLPVWGRSWPVSVKELADKVLEKVVEYADAQGFSEVLMSSFVSNFNAIHDHFGQKYPTTVQEIKKMNGFEHLKALGLWDNYASRNEYLESFSSHWNYSIKRVDPNNPKQTLLLRTVWQSDSAQLSQEVQPAPVQVASEKTKPVEVKKYTLRNTIRRLAIGLILAAPLLLTPKMALAAQFTHNPNGTLQVMVEKNDTFGQILLDAGYKGPLWGTNGVVEKMRGDVETQIPSNNVNHIKPGYHFNISSSQYSLETQRTIDQVNHQIESVQSELRNLRQTDGNLKVQVADLRAKLNQATEQINQLKSTHKLPDETAQLQSKKDDIARQIAGLEMRQTQAREELNRLITEGEKTKQEVTNLQNQKPGIQQEAKGLKGEVNQLKTQKEQVQGQVTQLQSQKGTLGGSINQLNQEKGNLDNQLSDLRQQVARAKSVLDQANVRSNPSFNNIWSNFSWLQKLGIFLLTLTGVGIIIAGFIMWKRIKRFEGVNEKVNELQGKVDEIEKHLNLKKENEELNREVELKRKENAELEAARATQEAQLRAESEELALIKGEYEQVQEDIAKAKGEKETVVADLESRINQLNAELMEKQARLTSITSEVETAAATSRIFTLQKEIAGLQSTLASLQEERVQKANQISQEITGLTGQRDELVQEISQLNNDLETRKVAVAEEDQKIVRLKKEAGTYEQNIEDLKRRITAFQEEIRSLEQQKDTASQELASLKDTTEAQAEREALNNEILEVQGNLSRIKSEIATLQTQRGQLEQGLTDYQTQKGKLESEITTLNQRINELTEGITRLESQEAAFIDQDFERAAQLRKDQINQQIEGLTRQKDDLTGQVQALQQQFETQQRELSLAITEAEIRAASVRDEISAFNRELAILRQAKAGFSTESASLQRDIEAKRDELTHLVNEKDTLEQNIIDLQTQKTAFQGNLERSQQEFAAAQQRLRELQETLAQTQVNEKTLTDQQNQIQSQGAQKQRIQEEITALNQELARKAQEFQDAQAKIEEINAQFNTILIQRDTASQEVEQLNASIVKLMGDVDKLKNDIDGLELAKDILIEEIATLEEKQKQLSEEIEAKQRVEEIQPVVDDLVEQTGAVAIEADTEVSKPLDKRIPPDDFKAVSERYSLSPDSLIQHLKYALGRSALGQEIENIYVGYPTVYDWFSKQDFYKDFKQKAVQSGLDPNFDRPGKVVDFKEGNDSYSLELSDRGPEYLIRGLFSGDCTNPYFTDSSFQSATLRHLVMPAFLNFKVLRDKEWVGNIYAVVIEQNGKPVLIIDAMQIPWLHEGGKGQPAGGYLPSHLATKLFPVLSFKEASIISDGAIEGLKQYAQRMGFNQLWHSSFISNFYNFKDYYGKKYQSIAKSSFDSLNMMVGYKSMQDELDLGRIYIESNSNAPAWIIWQGKIPQPTVTLPTTIVHGPEEFVDAIGKGEFISPETRQILLEKFHISPAWLADRLKQRMRESRDVKKVFEILGTGVNISQWMRQNRRESGYGKFEEEIRRLGISPEFDKPGLQIQIGEDQDNNGYKLVLSNRDADDLVRGYISADCTNPGWQHASFTFSKYVPDHILSPGFLNFKIYRRSQHGPYEWIGNVYAAVIRKEGKGIILKKGEGILLIDAIQIPWEGIDQKSGMEIQPLPSGSNPRIPFTVKGLKEAQKISDIVIGALTTQYAHRYGFTRTYLGFGSNFSPLVGYFYKKYADNYNKLLPPSETIVHGQGGAPDIDAPDVNKISEREYSSRLKSLKFDLLGLSEDKLDSFPNAPYARRGFAEIDRNGLSAGSAKGKGMFTPTEHQSVNQVIATAQRERRGQLIWGSIGGWTDNRAKYAQNLKWVIDSLKKRYSTVKIPKLGKIDIADILSASNIVLITPRANASPGLLVNDKNSYQIAHNGLSQNSIYIDQYTYSQLQVFEIAILLAHEAIQLGAKKLAEKRGIPWSEQLAREVTGIADEWEIAIVGRSDKGRGSRFDERIQDILGFNQQRRPDIVQPQPFELKPEQQAYNPPPRPQPKPYATSERPEPKPQPLPQGKPQDSNGKFNLDFPDTKDSVVEGLKQMFWDSMFKDTTDNLPVKWEAFPPPMAREIKNAHDLGKINRMPLDPTLLAALTIFFSRIFPNHTNSLINYLKTLHIFIIDNERSTFGATLDGDTFYIQKSLFEDLLKKPLTVEEINQRIKNKDKELLVALFRIIIHEIGAAFYKTSHEVSQDLERIFTALLSRTTITLPSRTQDEFRKINTTIDLNSLPRLDWALYWDLLQDNTMFNEQTKGGIDLNQINIIRTGKTINIQFDPAQLKTIEQGGFEGFTPVITNIIRIQNPLLLLGINNNSMLVKDQKVYKESVTL